jgi:2-polyprenyl-3-methyl-5-hydroxy-6-metoxy-1,4-benzoquinol methylase
LGTEGLRAGREATKLTAAKQSSSLPQSIGSCAGEGRVESTGKAKGKAATHYDANYANFQSELYSEIRREAYGEDIGQNSWLTAEEQDILLGWLNLSAGKKVLDVACGLGGPALRMAAKTGCRVVGIDLHEQAIAAARSLTSQRKLEGQAEFHAVNATEPLPFAEASFDAITCIDGINHLANRPKVMAQWAGLLKPGGRLLFSDPLTVTGPLSNEEIAVRTSAGFFLFVPKEYDREVIAQSGLRLLASMDHTANTAEIAERRRAAREAKSAALRQVEGDRLYETQQEFLKMAARLAGEGRLSRLVYVCERPEAGS